MSPETFHDAEVFESDRDDDLLGPRNGVEPAYHAPRQQLQVTT
jgi:hypothetical protein